MRVKDKIRKDGHEMLRPEKLNQKAGITVRTQSVLVTIPARTVPDIVKFHNRKRVVAFTGRAADLSRILLHFKSACTIGSKI